MLSRDLAGLDLVEHAPVLHRAVVKDLWPELEAYRGYGIKISKDWTQPGPTSGDGILA